MLLNLYYNICCLSFPSLQYSTIHFCWVFEHWFHCC